MRTVTNSREVYHWWANQAQSNARNSSDSVSFSGDTAYSYGTPIGRIVRNAQGERAYLVSTRSYSTTTAKHQSYLRRAIPYGATVFHVPEVGAGGWNQSREWTHVDYLANYRQEIEAEGLKAQRARKYGDFHLSRQHALMEEADAYCRFYGLAEQFGPVVLEELRIRQLQAERRLAEREREENARRDAQRRQDYEEIAEQWKAGEQVVAYGYPDVLLRVNPDNPEEIETSKGAHVPMHHARRLFDAWLGGTAGAGDRVGHYTVARVDGDEAIQIGCHHITRHEAERLAESLGWTPAREVAPEVSVAA